jgi:HSP20 family protein
MTMRRDLIPWSRGRDDVPAFFRGGPITTLHREVDRMFDDMLGSAFPSFGGGTSWPSVDVSETDDEVRISADMPGMSEDDVELSVEEGLLTLRGEKKSETEDKERGYSERFYGKFERRIPLPTDADEESCEARFRNGVLTVTIARSRQRRRGRRIPIKSEA